MSQSFTPVATAREYYDLLVKTSAEGGFPAIERLGGSGPTCRYRTDDGRACGVGVLLPDDLAQKLDKSSAPSIRNVMSRMSKKLAPYIPAGVDRTDLIWIQTTHDRTAFKLQPGESWPHDEFVKELAASVPCFKDFTPEAQA